MAGVKVTIVLRCEIFVDLTSKSPKNRSNYFVYLRILINQVMEPFSLDETRELQLKEFEELAVLRLDGEPLSPEVLCGDRLSQMTKTYNDIDAVTRLLEEKERDLELAARIGQSLLEQNKELRQRNEQLEQEYSITNDTVDHLSLEVFAATDRVTQLRHELHLKSGLLQVYSQDLETDSEAGTPTKEKLFINNWETLQKKIQTLEDENVELRAEASVRMEDIEEVEKKELQLISDCVRELSDSNKQLGSLQDEVAKKTEDSLRQQEEITQLLSQVVELQQKNRILVAENIELRNKLLLAKECQNELSTELMEMKEKYGELLAAFQELQEESRKTARRNTLPTNSSGMWPYGSYSPYANPDSLASELESTLGRDSDGYGSDERTSQSKKIFETVKFANGSRFVRQRRSPTCSTNATTPTYTSCFNPGTSSKFSSFGQLSSISSHLASDSESAYADSYHTDDESLYSSLSSTGNTLPPGLQAAGSSLAQELEVALRQQSQQSHNSGTDPMFARSATPDSIMSGSSSLGGQITYYMQGGTKSYHLPEKLQIVKPLEGSQTLHHWQKLATPHLGAILEVRQGVQVKGGDKPEEPPEPENYSLSDYEEDEDYLHPGKSFVGTGSVFTFTNSTILHPSDHTLVTPSYPCLQLSTRIGSQPPSSLNSPQTTTPTSYRNRATSTYSTTQGLAKLLNERGIHGMVPTVISNRDKQVASTTPTPAPSPENSPPPSPPPYSPVRVPDLLNNGASIARGSHLLKSKSKGKKTPKNSSKNTESSSVNTEISIANENRSCESKSQQTILSIRLLEKLSRIGLENIMATTASSVFHRSTSVSRRNRGIALKTISDESPLTLGAIGGGDCAMVMTRSNRQGLISSTQAKVQGQSDGDGLMAALSPPSSSSSQKSSESNLELNNAAKDSLKRTPNSPLGHSWGYVPGAMKSPASLGLTPGVGLPLSCMPNPMLQLNSLRVASGRGQDVGTVETLRILRKGGYS